VRKRAREAAQFLIHQWNEALERHLISLLPRPNHSRDFFGA
jgi:hypothetical protein